MPGNSFSLPHGANGIEVGDFVIEFLGDKIVALAKGTGEHYTIHLGANSGILDIHRTWRDADGQERHQTIFAMRHVVTPAFLGELTPMVGGMFRLIRKLRVGWLDRHDIGIVRGLEALTDDELAAVTKRRPKRKRIVIDEDKLKRNLRIPGYRDELWDFPDGAFSLFSGARRIGVGFKITDTTGYARLFWVKVGDMNRFGRSAQEHILAVAAKYAIPPEEYAQYRVLAP